MSRRLLLLNGLAILSVLLYHAAGWGFTAMFSWPHRYLPVQSPNFDQAGSAAYFALRVFEQLCVFSIPAFLFVSGIFAAFSFGRAREGYPWRTVASRLSTLIIPYLVWSAALMLSLLLQGRGLSIGQAATMVLTGSVNPAYYFVPLLVQLYLLAPLLTATARRRPAVLLAVTGALQILVYLIQYPLAIGTDSALITGLAQLLPKWFFPMRLFWFSFGIVAGLNIGRFKEVVTRRTWALLGAAAVLLVLGVLEWEALLRASGQPWIDNRETLVDGLYAGALVLGFLGLGEPSRRLAPLATLGALSFGIYLVHAPVMELLARGLYHLAPWVLSQQALLLPAIGLVGLVVPLLLMAVVKRSPLRRLSPVLFG